LLFTTSFSPLPCAKKICLVVIDSGFIPPVVVRTFNSVVTPGLSTVAGSEIAAEESARWFLITWMGSFPFLGIVNGRPVSSRCFSYSAQIPLPILVSDLTCARSDHVSFFS
jgi:hypothetical protein